MLFDLFFIRNKEPLSWLWPLGHLAPHLRGLQVASSFLERPLRTKKPLEKLCKVTVIQTGCHKNVNRSFSKRTDLWINIKMRECTFTLHPLWNPHIKKVILSWLRCDLFFKQSLLGNLIRASTSMFVLNSEALAKLDFDRQSRPFGDS